MRRLALLAPSLTVVSLALLAPLALMLLLSAWHYVPGRITDYTFTTENYRRLFADGFYARVIGQTLALGAGVTLLSAVLGYPLAFVLARTRSRLQPFMLLLVFVPMTISLVVRAYGWMVILGFNGLLNSALMALGVVAAPLRLLNSIHAVVLGLTEVLLPFMVLPLVAALKSIPPAIEEAARAIGATPGQGFLRVTLPLSMPGLVSGALMVFSLSITAYALPALLGGAQVKMVSALAYDSMMVSYNWPFGAAVGIAMVLVSTALVYAYLRIAPKGA